MSSLRCWFQWRRPLTRWFFLFFSLRSYLIPVELINCPSDARIFHLIRIKIIGEKNNNLSPSLPLVAPSRSLNKIKFALSILNEIPPDWVSQFYTVLLISSLSLALSIVPLWPHHQSEGRGINEKCLARAVLYILSRLLGSAECCFVAG